VAHPKSNGQVEKANGLICAGIKIKYASVAHPKSNGQVEKANGLICAGLKTRLLRPLKRAVGAWVEELPLVL
jgi:hypothetical protein